ncbi:hypothetical protein JTE90_002821 [Oedothorax gibbosus]|uniref:Angiotensin-converting enzyme n=1 Tax=Oedothorax gibbosus TaxID=931172 RepID=A0AAV6U762_9ARAC|nr:hypothetical protein JTE90_002821 [Oedothorax gibbosus]
MKKAQLFMRKANEIHLAKLHESSVASFNYSTNMTDYNKKIEENANKKISVAMDKIQKKAKEFNWKSFKGNNSTLYRWFLLFLKKGSDQDSPNKKSLSFRSGDSKTENPGENMEEIFHNAKVCSYSGPKKCSLTLEPDLNEIMMNSGNYNELKHYWKQFRDQTGKKMRNSFIQFVEENNKQAKEKGFKDYGEQLLSDYESESFQEDMAEVMKKICPLYKQLHAYVRAKLRGYYNHNAITKDGPIPAHILGDMYAQKWRGIFSIVNPFPKHKAPNVTDALIQKKMKPIDMFMVAERFFVSIGLKKMTPYFWHYSMIEDPHDRKVECHGTAYDMHNNKDYRIKMCTTINEEMLETIHHEMGHIQYFMHYNHLPGIFQASANSGFHEAIGDSMSLSAQTPDYLQKIGLLKKNETINNSNIIFLLRTALTYLSGVPYAYIIDHYRNRVYNGSIKMDELNKMYWQDRLDFQGVCPPVKRTEADFDIGAKFHIATNVEYFRYFFSNVFQFQIHKVLCQEAGHKGPLHKCSIYNSKKAGKKFATMLKLGYSKQWQVILNQFSDGKYKKLDPGPLLEYFEPLFKWLKKENRNETIGWKSENPMQCPKS